MDLTLDINFELYPLQKEDKITLVLASSLARGPVASEGTGEGEEKERDLWRPDGKGRRGLEEDFEYVMYGKVCVILVRPGSNRNRYQRFQRSINSTKVHRSVCR